LGKVHRKGKARGFGSFERVEQNLSRRVSMKKKKNEG